MKRPVVYGILASVMVALVTAALPQISSAYCYTACHRVIHRRIASTTVIERIDRPVIVKRVIRRPVVVERVVRRPVVVERIVRRPVFVERVIERPTMVETAPVVAEPVYVYRHHKGLIPKAYSVIFGGG